MNDEELGVSVVSASQVFIPDGDVNDLFVDEKDFDPLKDEEKNDPQPEKKEEKPVAKEESAAPSKEKKEPDTTHVKDEDVLFVDDLNNSASGGIDYKKSILELSRLGIIDEVTEDSEFEGEDGEVVKFSDLEIDSEDLYKDYVKNLYEEKHRKELEEKIDLKGVSDFTKKIIEIDKAGGNVSAVLEAKSNALDPIADLDLSREADQKRMIEHYLQVRYAEMSKDDIDSLIKSYEDRGVLEEKAGACKESIEKALSDYMENEKKKAEEAKAAFTEQYKTYKKSLKESLSSQFQVKDDYAKKVLDFATKLDDRNNFENLSHKFREMLAKPESAADLALFLFDREEYVRQKTNKVVSEERRTTFKKLSTASKKSNASTADVIRSKDKEEDEFIPIKEKIIYKGSSHTE